MSGLKYGDPILANSLWSMSTLSLLQAWKVMKMDFANSAPDRLYAKEARLK